MQPIKASAVRTGQDHLTSQPVGKHLPCAWHRVRYSGDKKKVPTQLMSKNPPPTGGGHMQTAIVGGAQKSGVGI